MNIYEIGLKVILDAAFTLIFTLLLSVWLPLTLATIFLSWAFAHTINWIFNGHIYVLLRYVHPVPQSREHFETFIQELGRRGHSYKSVDGIAIFGSYCRGCLHENSDLDVRILVRPGIVNGIQGALYCLLERMTAVLMKFPLDIYSCVGLEGLSQLRSDEIPVLLSGKSPLLRNKYPQALHKRTDGEHDVT